MRPPILLLMLLVAIGTPSVSHAQTVVTPRLTLDDPLIQDQDDMCIWVHPSDSTLSAVIASDKTAGKIFVYDLAGTTLQVVDLPGGQPGNIDVRYKFNLQGNPTDIVGVNDRNSQKLLFYRMDPQTRTLERIDNNSIGTASSNYGFSLYISPQSGKYYAFSSTQNGIIEQFELTDASGQIAATRVRTWDIGGITEGSVCDDENGVVFFGEEDVAIWKFGAEPGDPTVGTTVATVGDASGIVADIEGLTLYYAAKGEGYLIASSQGNSSFRVFQRKAPHAFVSSFTVANVLRTDGIDVTNVNLGPAFPKGIFVVHNDRIVPRPVEVCRYEDLGLLVDTDYWKPRDGTPSNTAPVVSAGPDRTITLPASAALDGTVSDDGLPNPPGAVTTSWGVVSGPGPVTFQNPNAVDTQASFTVAGTYVLSLTGNDGALSASDQVRIIVQPPAGSLDRRVAVGSDDAEEKGSGGSIGHVSVNDSDLELVFDTANQIVGLRFTNVTIPPGATITRAYVQLQADELQSEVTNLLIRGQAADNPATFTTATGNVSTRPLTTAAVSWSPPAWTLVGEAGAKQRTPELKTVIQQVVSRPAWASGNALVIIITGTGHRTAESYEGRAASAPLLHVEFTSAPVAEVDGPRLEFALLGVYPNPSRGPLSVVFRLEDRQPATLELLDVTSRRVAVHEVGSSGPGRHQLDLKGGLPAGVYVVRLTQGGQARVMKAVLLR